MNWAEVDCLLAGISASAKGERGWPPLALFRALDDRASFRRFCGFAAHEPTPERTTFVRLRRELVRRRLDRSLFETVTRQLDSRGVVVRSRCQARTLTTASRGRSARS